jgi:hypothetical protein
MTLRQFSQTSTKFFSINSIYPEWFLKKNITLYVSRCRILSPRFKILKKGVPDSINKNDEKKFIKKLFLSCFLEIFNFGF